MLSRSAAALYANAYILLSLTSLFWAGNFVVGRGIHGDVPPVALALARWTIATLIVLPFAFRHLRRDWVAIRERWGIILFLGITGAGLFNTIAYLSLNYTTALNALVLQSSGPVLIALASFIFFRDRIAWPQGLGILVSLAGVIVMITQGDPGVLAALQLNIGDLGILLAMITWAVYTAFLRKRPAIHWLSFVAVTFAVAVAFNAPLAIAEHLSGWQMQPTRQTLLAIAYVSIFPGLLAYICFNRGVELIGANRAGVFMHLVPFFGAALAITLLGEALRLYHLIGIALILAGVTLAARKI